jgi:hypothetical protein
MLPTAQQKIEWTVEDLEVALGMRIRRTNSDGDDDVFEYDVATITGPVLWHLRFDVHADGAITMTRTEVEIEKVFMYTCEGNDVEEIVVQ